MPPQASKFSGIFDAKKTSDVPVQERTEPSPLRPGRRLTGKRSDPNYTNRTVQMRNDLHLDATELLRRHRKGQDFSGLVNDLVEEWLKKQKAS